MKAAAIFLLSLCFLVLGTSYSVRAAIPQQSTHNSAARHIQKAPQSKLEDKKDYALSSEDEDEGISVSRKAALLSSYFFTLSYIALYTGFYHFLKKPLPSCRHLLCLSSSKYILQRVLRL